MKKKTKNKIFSQKNIIFLFIAGTLLFSCSLYYKQYLPKYRYFTNYDILFTAIFI